MPTSLTLIEIGTFLATGLGTGWTVNDNIVLGWFGPDTADEAIALIEIFSFIPGHQTFGASGAGFNIEQPQIQVLSRAGGKDYRTARENAEDAWVVLREVLKQTLGSTYYYYFNTHSTPYFDSQDDNSRFLITFTMDVWKEPTA